MSKALITGAATLIAIASLSPAAGSPAPDFPAAAWGAGSNGRLGTGSTSDALSPLALQGPAFSILTAGTRAASADDSRS